MAKARTSSKKRRGRKKTDEEQEVLVEPSEERPEETQPPVAPEAAEETPGNRSDPVAVAEEPSPAVEVAEPEEEATDESTHAKYERVKKGSLHIKDLQKLNVAELHEIAKKEGITEYTGLKKQDLIFQILKERIRQNGLMYGEGVLEILPDGFGFLRSPEYNYLPSPGRHLRLPVADPPLRPADRQRRRGPDPSAEGVRAVLRPAARRGDQLRGPRALVREGRSSTT